MSLFASLHLFLFRIVPAFRKNRFGSRFSHFIGVFGSEIEPLRMPAPYLGLYPESICDEEKGE